MKSAVTSENAVEIDKDYAVMLLNASWVNYNAVQSMELVSPTGTTYVADSIEERNGTITVNNAKKGTYTLRVTGVNIGDVYITLSEVGEVEEPESQTSEPVVEGTESLTESSEEITSMTEE